MYGGYLAEHIFASSFSYLLFNCYLFWLKWVTMFWKKMLATIYAFRHNITFASIYSKFCHLLSAWWLISVASATNTFVFTKRLHLLFIISCLYAVVVWSDKWCSGGRKKIDGTVLTAIRRTAASGSPQYLSVLNSGSVLFQSQMHLASQIFQVSPEPTLLSSPSSPSWREQIPSLCHYHPKVGFGYGIFQLMHAADRVCQLKYN